MRIAIIGSGISGLSAAYALRDRHDLVLYEQGKRPGGHVRTVTVAGAGGAVAVDMGFIVYNEPTYPRFSRLLDELGVPTQPTEMSFGHRCSGCDLEFGSVGVAGLLATPRAATLPGHWRMVADLVRFHREARRRLESGHPSLDTLDSLLRQGGYGESFRRHFVLPVVSAIWSTPADDSLALLADADAGETDALERFGYTRNDVVLHTDDRLLPRRIRARGSWNVDTIDCQAPGRLTMTYDMVRLQRLAGTGPLLVSVNPGDRVATDRIIESDVMTHPRYTFRTLEGQRAVARLQGHRRTWYAGAHLGYGFHEDGCRSGFEAASDISERLDRLAA
jgi:predicted NAD/FAD-binding protein